MAGVGCSELTFDAEMGVISFEINANSAIALHHSGNSFSSHGVSISWRPFLGIPLNTRRRNSSKIQLSCAQKFNCAPVSASLETASNTGLITNNGLLSNELQFKPSFDDYLKEMESTRRTIRVKETEPSTSTSVIWVGKKQASSTEKLKTKRENGMSKIPRSEGDEASKKFVKLGGRVGKKNGALKVAQTIMGREGSSVGNGNKLRERGAKRFKHEYDGKESKPDVTVKKKLGAEVMTDRWLKRQNHSSKPESDNRSLIRSERGRIGNTKDLSNWKNSRGRGEVRHELHSLKAVGKKDATTSRKDHNSKEKMPMEDKIVVSNNVMLKGLERGYTKNKNVVKENGQENVKFNGSRKHFVDRGYDYENLEVEREAFKTLQEFNGVIGMPQVSHKEMEDRIQRLAQSYVANPFFSASGYD